MLHGICKIFQAVATFPGTKGFSAQLTSLFLTLECLAHQLTLLTPVPKAWHDVGIIPAETAELRGTCI